MPTNDKPTGNRRNVPLFVTMPPEERDRVAAFARKVGRPLSWAVRDGLRLYLDAVEADAEALARVKVDPSKAGWTKMPKRGRPPTASKLLERMSTTDPAALQTAMDAVTRGTQPKVADVEALLAELERNPTATPKGKGKANVR